MMNRTLALFLAMLLIILTLSSCSNSAPNAESTATPEPTEVPEPEYEVFEEDGRQGLKYGDEVIADAIWQEIRPCSGYEAEKLFTVEMNGLYGLMSASGELLIEPTWDFCSAHGNLLEVTVKDQESHQIVSLETKKTICTIPGWMRGFPSKDNKFTSDYVLGNCIVYDDHVKTKTWDNVKAASNRTNTTLCKMNGGIVSLETGKKLFTFTSNFCVEDVDYYKLEDYGYRLTPVWDYGFIIMYGNRVIGDEIFYKTVFISNTGKTLDINMDSAGKDYYAKLIEGTSIMETGYLPEQHLYDISNGIQEIEGGPFDQIYIDSYPCDDGVLVFATKNDGKDFCLINLSQKTVYDLKDVVAVNGFSDGMAAIMNKNKKWGYINTKGEMVYDFQFDDAPDFKEGKAEVVLDYKKVTIDLDGNIN